MNADIRIIRSLTFKPVANLFAVWYGFWGIVSGTVFVSSNAKSISSPVGLLIPFVDVKLNLISIRAPTLPGAIVLAMFHVLLCAATGWISGLLTALAYNLLSRRLHVQLRGSTETLTPSDG
jgi:hypothetical protein